MKNSLDRQSNGKALSNYIIILKRYKIFKFILFFINIIFNVNLLYCSSSITLKDKFFQEALPQILKLSETESDILHRSEKISIEIEKEKKGLDAVEELFYKLNSQLELKKISKKHLYFKEKDNQVEDKENINNLTKIANAKKQEHVLITDENLKTNNQTTIIWKYQSLKHDIKLLQKENKILLSNESQNISNIVELINKWENLTAQLEELKVNEQEKSLYLELSNLYKNSIKKLKNLRNIRETNERLLKLYDKHYEVLFTGIEISESISRAPTFSNINLSNTMGLTLRLKANKLPESIDNDEVKKEITNFTNEIFKKNLDDYQYKCLEVIFKENNILNKLNILRNIEKERYIFYLNELDNETKKLNFLINDCKKLVNNYCIKLQDSLPMQLCSIYEACNELIWFIKDCKFSIYMFIRQFIIIAIFYSIFLIFLRNIYFHYHTFLNEINNNIGTINRDNIYNTLTCISWEILNSSKLPFLLLISGTSLLYFNQTNNPASIQAMGRSLINTSLVSLLMSSLYSFSKKNGIFEKHFKINRKPLEIIFYKWPLLSFIFQFTLFILLSFTDINIAHRVQTIAKFSLINMCLVTSIFIVQVIRSDIKIFAVSTTKFKGLLDKILILTTLFIVFYTAKRTYDGFFVTSKVIMNSLCKSVIIWISLMLLYQMIIRIMVLHRRRIAFELSLQQREELLANRLKKFSEENENQDSEELEIDLEKLSSQTIKLVRSLTQLIGVLSLLTICSKIKPIFNILALPIPFLHEATPLTIFSTTLFCYLVYLLYANLPSLLDLIIFTKFDLTQSSRYNLKYFTKISVLLCSIIIACNLLNLDTNNIALLGTIFTASIGFGLRDLVSSIFSGFIILTMKSLRVGDTVRINNINGIVTQITILNTTLLAVDKKEIVIPNKNLLNEIFIMWPSEEFVYRTVFSISIPIKFHTLNVLNKIQKSVESIYGISSNETFMFSVSSGQLNYEMRVFIADIENTENIQTEIFNNILKNLEELGIPRECINIKQLDS